MKSDRRGCFSPQYCCVPLWVAGAPVHVPPSSMKWAFVCACSRSDRETRLCCWDLQCYCQKRPVQNFLQSWKAPDSLRNKIIEWEWSKVLLPRLLSSRHRCGLRMSPSHRLELSQSWGAMKRKKQFEFYDHKSLRPDWKSVNAPKSHAGSMSFFGKLKHLGQSFLGYQAQQIR